MAVADQSRSYFNCKFIPIDHRASGCATLATNNDISIQKNSRGRKASVVAVFWKAVLVHFRKFNHSRVANGLPCPFYIWATIEIDEFNFTHGSSSLLYLDDASCWAIASMKSTSEGKLTFSIETNILVDCGSSFSHEVDPKLRGIELEHLIGDGL